jgi:dihydrofolate reductase
MRKLRYGVATSLDGFIAGPNGEYDWIVPDSGIDFAAMWAQFDIALMGRKTFEIANSMRASFSGSVSRWVVVSSTLKAEDYPGITVISTGVAEAVAALKAEPGPEPQKDIWLFGGGVLFRFLLDAGLVDAIDVSVMPVLLGSGIPLLPEGRRQSLHLETSKTLPSGILLLSYDIVQQPPRAE